ncbi:hypothetical protein E8E14_000833 [Neopestalotiopsis sp. 37M]|nr:hypothetical protein E8E14_000833 [Neopestalotiopsis sp. 37M]
MAAAALMSPANAYHPHNTAYQPSYMHHSPAPMPGILNQADALRRTSKDSEPAQQRQSLPSISEMFNSAKPTYSPTTPTTAGPTSLPPPPPPQAPHSAYSNNAPPRPEPPADNRAPPAVFSRPENTGPGPAYQFGEHRDYPKPQEPPHHHHQRNDSFASSQGPSGPYPGPSPLPPGQLPLSSQGGPISPRHAGPPMGPQYESQRPPMQHPDEEYCVQRRYDPNQLNRQFEAWGYGDCLQKLMWASRTIYNFAEAYSNLASEQPTGQPHPNRLPTEKEVADMLHNTDYVRKTLESIREHVHHSIASEKAREGGKHRGSYDDDDVSMYGDGSQKHYGLGEVKKRRGRAAPPGRCHSCNRIDTPEWRRGPDGARTLCNACGLHYAKLERKRQMEQRSMRTKAVE